MSIKFVLSYLIRWGLIGSGLFLVYVVVAFRTGLVYTARKADGTLKEEMPLKGYAAMVTFVAIFLGYLVVANFMGLGEQSDQVSFSNLFLLNYGLYLVLFLFDTFFVDAFLIGIWRPGFLELPPQMGRESMRRHILKSIPVGLASGVILAGLSAGISMLLLG